MTEQRIANLIIRPSGMDGNLTFSLFDGNNLLTSQKKKHENGEKGDGNEIAKVVVMNYPEIAEAVANASNIGANIDQIDFTYTNPSDKEELVKAIAGKFRALNEVPKSK